MTSNDLLSDNAGGGTVIGGILNLNKPAGITSMELVRRIKRASRQKRVGHAGTLDPLATGVVPVCLGQATRVMEYLLDDIREYLATVELGVERDTYDLEGQITATQDPSGITRGDIERVLPAFQGNITQVPPMYSALRYKGSACINWHARG
jgi:tRNA pseudouridine55 synthase